MTEVLTAVDTVVTLVGDVFTLITGNPLLAAFVAVGLLGSTIGLFSQLRNAAQ